VGILIAVKEDVSMPEKHKAETRAGQSHGPQGIQRSSARDAGLSRQQSIEGPGSGPFAIMRRMQDDLDRWFGTFGLARGWPAFFGDEQRADWTPAIEAFQRGNEFVVRADVPGLSRENVTVEIGEDTLTISGERKHERKEEREGIFRSERSYGSFCRVIPLPEGALAESAKANFKDGVLEVTMQAPSREVRRGRRIEIGDEGPEASPR
jgi:HSP20 family protein